MPMDALSDEIEVRGHLIDSSVLPRIFDVIMDLGGEFDVLAIDIGKKKTDPSFARLVVRAGGQGQLDRILEAVYRQGATSPGQKEALLRPADRDMVMPDNF